MQNVELLQFPNPDALAAAAASAWLDEIESTSRSGRPYCVALSGGRITEKFFLLTAEKGLARKTPFEHVHFFWADERCVPPDDPESNFKLADDLLFQPLGISESQIYRLRGELAPEAAVAQANEEIARVAPSENGQPILDLVHLGMGEDGHVASLFQNARLETEKSANCNGPFIFVSDSPKPPPHRISLNFKAIAAARRVWALVSGLGKEAALKNTLNAEGKTSLGQVIKLRTNTKIFVDIRV
ncbi:MAG TPA: 6-phosphogluconolactonase [Pseudomonadales bacterium]|nr:6-phosphogluconolactonase [Pseudomonadales bacterium]